MLEYVERHQDPKIGFPKDAITKWQSVHVNTYGCNVNLFTDENCEDQMNDQFIYKSDKPKTYAGGFKSGDYQNTKGQCTNLVKTPIKCIRSKKPCLHPIHHHEKMKKVIHTESLASS